MPAISRSLPVGTIAHTREDAEVMFRRIKFAYDSLPAELKVLRSVNTDNARELQLSNGSTSRVGTSMRSSTLQYLHISEFGKICAKFPDKAREIITGSLNALAPGQYVFIESTAEGREGYFYQICKEVQTMQATGEKLTPLDFRFHFYPWWHISYRIDPSNVVVPTHYLDYFNKSKPYIYGKHLVPHDAAAHEYSTVLSRVEVARNHGIAFTIAPDLALIDLLNRCWFDGGKCVSGIKALERYKKEWNDRYGC